MQILISSLASPNLEKRGVAARTLGDLVQKMGERILIEIIPILEVGLQSDHADTREGVCAGMTEIISAAGKNHLLDFIMHCTPLVKAALVDSVADVREAAAQTFDVLYQHLGNKVIDDILPSLLADLKTGNSEFALEALKEMMSVRSNGILPVLSILLQGLMYGSGDSREQSALGLGEIISRTSETSLKPFVTQITGPLIRVIGDRFPPNVKSAILQTMATLLHRVPAMLKPFLPQLQRTFVKSLSDPSSGSSAMRSRAAKCLTLLIPYKHG
ncbi:hypothetical protein BASA81_013796 [Batrachochytrium salamandrivorans]|nr:hypothetical protein BASA81_013796 [Batrachochytrium salamandrivorans]